MAFSYASWMDAIKAGASHLVALAASGEQSIHDFRADHPFVDQALTLAENDFPGLKSVESAAHTILLMAQSAVLAITGSVPSGAAGGTTTVMGAGGTDTVTAPAV